ncbi:hypothetical protein J31TS4_41550 [Paenibacillus sp. J31TS4]|uniref:PspC domain-containing protein n=1 Tax=Paenibacillus sp. J31TS4 TaxID=2807195 RepID=UPI001B11A8C0|nr:PspC domain-containing protein [Paenibacillus sp. J31TS4]GIP40875.1 hypothetical protein J31TS4_41550 [Paenibacillus sp. J31TS4]
MTKLYRSRRDSKLFGICGGLSEMINVDSTLLRLIVVVTTIFSGGALIPIYIIAAMVIPKEPLEPGFPQGPFGHPGYAPFQQPYAAPYGGGYADPGYRPAPAPAPQADSGTHLDEVMKDIEKKALQREIEELRAKVAQYEKGE